MPRAPVAELVSQATNQRNALRLVAMETGQEQHHPHGIWRANQNDTECAPLYGPSNHQPADLR